MENIEHDPSQEDNPVDKEQATERATPEELRERARKLEEGEELRPSEHPNAGTGPRNDVEKSVDELRIGTNRAKTIPAKEDEDPETMQDLLVTDNESDEENMDDLLVTDNPKTEDRENGEGLDKAA